MRVTSVLITVAAFIGMTERCMGHVNLDQLLKYTFNNLLQFNTRINERYLATPKTEYKLGDPVPEHLMDLECQATQWTEECKAGIIHTYKDLNAEVCELFCQDEQNCKSYIIDQRGNCGLLRSAPGGTTKSIGISGPVLSIRKPKSAKGRGRSKAKHEDCSEFHFNSCSTEQLLDDYHNKEQAVKDSVRCKTLCQYNLLDEEHECRTFLYQDIHNNTFKSCWNTQFRSVSDFLTKYCHAFFGRVSDGRNPLDYDSCLLHNNADEDFDCKKGYCDLSTEIYTEIHVGAFKSERKCKLKCFTFNGCSHYEWNSFTKACRLLNQRKSPIMPVQPFTCKAAVGLKGADIDECTKVDCQWNEWTSWSECSVSCEKKDLMAGKRTRQRGKIAEAYPPGIGKECRGPNQETEECTAKHCGVCTNIKWTTTSHNLGYSWKFNLCEEAYETSTTTVTTETPTTPETITTVVPENMDTSTTPATTSAAHYVATTECCQDPGTYYLNCFASNGNGWQGGYLQVGSSPTKICLDFNSGANKTVIVDFP